MVEKIKASDVAKVEAIIKGPEEIKKRSAEEVRQILYGKKNEQKQ